MPQARIHIKGIPKFNRMIQKAAMGAKLAPTVVGKEAAKEFIASAKRNLDESRKHPKGEFGKPGYTSDLPYVAINKAWNYRVTENNVFIWNESPHGHMVEYGTGMITPKNADFLVFRTPGGEVIHAPYVAGQPPKFFVRDAETEVINWLDSGKASRIFRHLVK